jgi:photosystem II stability/assembly factor-like uncharacterized protein
MRSGSWSVLAGALVVAHVGVAFGGTNTWTDTGLKGANVRVEFSSSPDIVYARGGDKLWKSTDGGRNWTALFSKNAALVPFTVDPTNPNVVITGRGFFNDGIIRTVDGGATFDNQFFLSISAMKFSPDGTVVYGANFASATQILRSVDKGATWTVMATNGLPVSPGTQIYIPEVYSLAADRSNANIVYAGFRHLDYQGVYRSTDGGANWTPATGLLGLTVGEILSHPTLGVLAATSAGLFRSTDTGATWSRITDSSSSGVTTADLSSVAFDRVDPQILYAGGTLRGEIFFSSDGGASWTRRDTGVVASRINTLAPRPGHAGEVLAGTSHTLYRSTDSAQNWTVSADGLYAANITSLQNGSRLRAGLEDGGIYESLDGLTWTPLNNAGLRARMPNNRFSLIADMIEGNRLLVMPAQSAVLNSATLGATWQPLPPTYPTTILHHFGGLLTLPGSGSDYLAGSNNGIFRTSDNGDTWSWSNTGMPGTTIRDFARNADGSAIYAATFSFGVYKSTNNGFTWTAANNGLTNLETAVLEYDTVNDVLVVGTNQGLFFSNNGGASYTELTNPWPGAQMSVNGIVVEDFVRGAIYVAFQKKVFRSVDSGITWTELSEGNPYSDSVIRITSMVGDGPGVLYLGNMASGLQTYTVSPDISISAGAPATGAFPIGTEIPWQFIVQNSGRHASTFTQASWQVPANVDVLDLVSSRGTCAVSGSRRLSCDFGVLPANQSATVTMRLRGNAGGTLGINLSAGSAEIDSVPANNSFTNSSVRFVESVDLAATLTAAPTLVDSGTPLEYTLVVANNGPDAATGGSFETTFDARDQYVLAQGSAAGCTGNVAGVQVCPLPTIAAGGSVTYRWTVTPQWGGARTPGVIVRVDSQNCLDTNLANNSATATANVVPVTDLSASITSAAPTVLQGSALALTATVTNNSLIDAAGVTATLTLSDRMTFSSATGAVCTSTGNVVGCAVGVLGAGASRAITVNVNAVSAGPATSTFSVASAGPDPVLPNNSANVVVTINPTNDLSVTLAGNNSALTGSQSVLTLTGNNLSAHEATGVRAEVTLGALVTYASATGATCTTAAAVVSCDLGTIAGNGSKAVSITVNAVTVGTATISAVISGTSPDPIATNNASSAQLSITAPPSAGGGSSSGGGGGGGGALDLMSVIALLGVLASMQSRRRRAAAAR